MFDASTDPLGIGVMQRAQQRRFQGVLDAIHSNSAAPTMLADPKWDGYFEAVDEANGGKPTRYGYAPDMDTSMSEDVNGNSYAGDRDLSRDPNHAQETFDAMPRPTLGNGPSEQLGTNVRLKRALYGLGAQ